MRWMASNGGPGPFALHPRPTFRRGHCSLFVSSCMNRQSFSPVFGCQIDVSFRR